MQVRMVSLHVISPRMKYQRLALSPAVVNHFTEEDHVVASLEFPNHSADKVSCGPFQQRAAFDTIVAVNFCEPICELRCKSAREMVLVRREDIYRKVARFGEI